MKVKFKLKEVLPRVFLVTIKDDYDLAMTFCRLQEFYESPFKNIRGKAFDMYEFQRMYAKKFGQGTFTYPMDWVGFNVPGHVFDAFIGTTFLDWGNEYDFVIEDIYTNIAEYPSRKFYVIGSKPEDTDTINHELCHALFYLDADYKNEALKSLRKLDKKLLSSATNYLLNIGYSRNSIKDELQAYITTDDYMIFDNIKMNKKQRQNVSVIKNELKNIFISKTENYLKKLKNK